MMKDLRKIMVLLLLAGMSVLTACEKDKDDDKDDEKEQGVELKNHQSFNNHTYAITSETMRWADAKQFAEEEGGYLVIIESQEENDFILSTYREPLNTEGDILWIGLSDHQEEGVFKWVNGESTVYNNWEEGEPNNADGIQHYVHMYSNGKWDDVDDIDCYAIIEFSE